MIHEKRFCKIIKVAILFLELVWNSKFVTSNLSRLCTETDHSMVQQTFYLFFFNSANVLMILVRSENIHYLENHDIIFIFFIFKGSQVSNHQVQGRVESPLVVGII